MMGNAAKNDVERASRVKKGREVEEKEEKDFEANKNDHSYYRYNKLKSKSLYFLKGPENESYREVSGGKSARPS